MSAHPIFLGRCSARSVLHPFTPPPPTCTLQHWSGGGGGLLRMQAGWGTPMRLAARMEGSAEM